VAMDPRLIVSGCADKTLKAWVPASSSDYPDHICTGGAKETQSPPLFDLSESHIDLPAHGGPVSTLCLTDRALYSGSWDQSVRTFTRSDDCPGALHLSSEHFFSDCESLILVHHPCMAYIACDLPLNRVFTGVMSVVARGKHLLVAAGSEVSCHDLSTGQIVRKFQDLHQSNVLAVEGTQNSKMLFTAAGEGLVMAHDLRMKNGSRLIWHHNAGGFSDSESHVGWIYIDPYANYELSSLYPTQRRPKPVL